MYIKELPAKNTGLLPEKKAVYQAFSRKYKQ
jgi:hypothetical protein